MEIEFRRIFKKDLAKIKDSKIRKKIKAIIEEVESVNNLTELRSLKAIQGHQGYYRLRLGDYRIGLYLDGNIIAFVRVLPRKDIYRYFP